MADVPIEIELRPVLPVTIERAPLVPISIEYADQAAPLVDLPGISVIEVGASAPEPYTTTFSDTVDLVVNHNFGRSPIGVRVLTPGGVEVLAQVTDTSINQLIVSFASPQSGTILVY